MCLCTWARCVTVNMCVWVCYGTVGIPNRRKNKGQKKSERKRQTQRNSLMRGERFYIWTHWTSLPAQLQNHLKFFSPTFFVHWSVSAYDNAVAPYFDLEHLILTFKFKVSRYRPVCVSQSSLEQLVDLDLSAVMGGSRQHR